MRYSPRRRHKPTNIVRKRRRSLNFPIASGPIVFVFNNLSVVSGYVQSYLDNVINLPRININDTAINRSILVTICRNILKSSANSIVRTYKLVIKRGNETLCTVPSVLYGSKQTVVEEVSDYEFYRGKTITGIQV